MTVNTPVLTAQDIALAPGQRVFLTSGGLLDRSGGGKRRSSGKTRFMEPLPQREGEPQAAHSALENRTRHQGQERRRGDVSVAGFSIR